VSVLGAVCCHVEVSASGQSLVHGGPTECRMSECDPEASIMRRLWPTRGCCTVGKKCDEILKLKIYWSGRVHYVCRNAE
jgi:hypothetical protein